MEKIDTGSIYFVRASISVVIVLKLMRPAFLGLCMRETPETYLFPFF